jgi:hypothetical protein
MGIGGWVGHGVANRKGLGVQVAWPCWKPGVRVGGVTWSGPVSCHQSCCFLSSPQDELSCMKTGYQEVASNADLDLGTKEEKLREWAGALR